MLKNFQGGKFGHVYLRKQRNLVQRGIRTHVHLLLREARSSSSSSGLYLGQVECTFQQSSSVRYKLLEE